tara:strand:+ start:318 stop:620 length:303 start_codon:yes stop_codon:yes gene_type:complete
MNIKTMEEGDWCHYCHQEFNGTEEGLVQEIVLGQGTEPTVETYYHLRCIGKLMVYRIEGVLPQHLFMACVEQLNKPLPQSLFIKIDENQTTLDEFSGEEE